MEHELELRRARQRAIHRVLGMLRSPIMLMCLPDRVEAERLCAEHAIAGGVIPPSLEVWHEGRCGRCGRALTVPESIASGIGPVCEGLA